jgi:hypothetical protein
MKEKEVVVISRNWNNPSINIKVTLEGISLETSLMDYMAALVEEIGNPTMLVTKAQLATRLEAARVAVVEKIKAESVKVM